MPHVASSVAAHVHVHSADSRSPHQVDSSRSCPGRLTGRSSSAARRGRDRAAQPAATRPATSSHGNDSQRPPVWALLARLCTPTLVGEVLARLGMVPTGGRLALDQVVYLVLGLCVLPDSSYQELLRQLWPRCAPNPLLPVPNKSSLARARARLGWRALADLFVAIASPLATDHTKGAFWRGLRLMAIDGFTLEVPDSPVNEQAWGGQLANGQRVGPPQPRMVALVECGTRAAMNAAIASYHVGEQELAAELAGSVAAGMLVLADRGFPSVALLREFTAGGGHVLWRVKAGVATKVVQQLPDGSYLARIRPSHQTDRWQSGQRPAPLLVRIIEYRLVGSPTVYRLITSLLDPQTAPALELAALYAERWEIEIMGRELKTYQQGARAALRSRSPEGVRQEIWAHLIVHYAIRAMAHEAATAASVDPDRISFLLALRIVRRGLQSTATLAEPLGLILRAAIDELTESRSLLHRRPRTFPRSVKHPSSRYPAHRPGSPRGGRAPSPLIELCSANS